MGVPRLAPWLFSMFEECVKKFMEGTYFFDVDNLYIDANPLLHSAAQFVHNYGQKKTLMKRFVNLTPEEKKQKLFEVFFRLIETVVSIARPRKLLFIAIDGVAPLAKQAEQMKRRFIAASVFDEKTNVFTLNEIPLDLDEFSSTMLTPGTKFMMDLTKYMNWKIRSNMRTGFFAGRVVPTENLEVIFSPPTVPGEGEHACLEHIRSLPDKNDLEHCIFGPDGDLIMLTLSAHTPNIFLLREVLDEQSMWHVINMGEVRKKLSIPIFGPLHARSLVMQLRSHTDVVNDFMVMGFLVGNDFLPKVQMFLFLENGLELMMTIAKEIEWEGHFLTKDGNISLSGFYEFVVTVATYEEKFIFDQASTRLPHTKFINHTLVKNITFVDGKPSQLNFGGFRRDYYKKLGIETEKEITKLCKNYLKSIVWVYKYYVETLPSWNFRYLHHHAPLMIDVAKVVEQMKEYGINTLDFSFKKGKPSPPFVQLLCVLPPSHRKVLLPHPFCGIKVKTPKTFAVDYEGKMKEFMGVALIPFPKMKVIKRRYKKALKTARVFRRNLKGVNFLFTSDIAYNKKYVSKFGTIENVKVRRTRIEE